MYTNLKINGWERRDTSFMQKNSRSFFVGTVPSRRKDVAPIVSCELCTLYGRGGGLGDFALEKPDKQPYPEVSVVQGNVI